MWPHTDNYQILIEKPLNDCFRKIKSSKSQLEEYLINKFEIHKQNNPNIGFPIIEIDIVYKDDKYDISFLDRFNLMKCPGFKRERTNHLLIILSNTLEWIQCHNLESVLPKHDFKMHFEVSDTYYEDSDRFPIFVQAKASDKILPLYPDHTYFRMSFIPNGPLYNWDQVKNVFKEYREYKPPIVKKIFFRGVDSTSNPSLGDNSNIRNKFKELSLHDPKTEIRVFPQSEASKRATPLFNDCGFETYLDLPGNFPWSFRKKFLYLTGGDVICVKSIWENKEWIQFIDQVLLIYPTNEVKFIYTRNEDNSIKLEDVYQEIKQIPRLKETIIKRRLEHIEILNMSRLYQYMSKMMVLCSHMSN